MTRNEYLEALERELRQLPKKDYREAMDYFTEYFDEAGPENEEDVIEDLGNPQDAAADIIKSLSGRDPVQSIRIERSKKEITLWIVLIILASPLILTALLTILGILWFILGMIILIACLIFTGFVFAVATVLVGFATLAETVISFHGSFSALLTGTGIFFTLIGFGTLLFLLCLYLFKFFRKGIVISYQWSLNLWENRKWRRKS